MLQKVSTSLTRLTGGRPRPAFELVKPCIPHVVQLLNISDYDVHVEQNILRTNPISFIPFLLAEQDSGKWNKADIQHAIQAINNHKQRLHPLQWGDGLSLAAKDHCKDLGPKGKEGHQGTDNSSIYDRISRYQDGGWHRGENISYRFTNVRDIVMDLFI